MTENTSTTAALLSKIDKAVSSVIIGKSAVIADLVAALLSGGHVLFEDVPGLGKTLLARSIAEALGLSFHRLQFTPDLLPGDVTGGYVLNPESGHFELRRGPVFTNVLLADEINRASPKTQSALLEAMQDGRVSIEGETFDLPDPFFVMATQNPIEYEGTFPLPEAQLDRFLLKLGMGYPTRDEERRILSVRRERGTDGTTVAPVTDDRGIQSAREEVETVTVSEDLEGYIVDIVAATRNDRDVSVGASPRGSLALLKLSRARAAALGRHYVIPDDIKHFAVEAIAHRLTLTPDLWVRPDAPERVVTRAVESVAVPVA
ncbi:MAG: AAA family ATPase [Spirochaetales bacterium]